MKSADVTIKTASMIGACSILAVVLLSLSMLLLYGASTLPALITLYNSDDYTWLGIYDFVILSICSISSFVIAVLTSRNALSESNRRSRSSALLLAVVFTMLSLWIWSLIGILLFGGGWHLSMIITSMTLAVSLVCFAAHTFCEFCKNK